jgi:hypothetical protein
MNAPIDVSELTRLLAARPFPVMMMARGGRELKRQGGRGALNPRRVEGPDSGYPKPKAAVPFTAQTTSVRAVTWRFP